MNQCKPHCLAVLWYFWVYHPEKTLNPMLQETGSKNVPWAKCKHPDSSRRAAGKQMGRAEAGGRAGSTRSELMLGKFSETRRGAGEKTKGREHVPGRWDKHRNTRLTILPSSSHMKRQKKDL